MPMYTALVITNKDGQREMVTVQLYEPRFSSDTYSSGDKLVRTDTEGSDKYVVATGFHRVRDNWFVVTSDGQIINEDRFRRPNEMEFDRFSKYPDTVALRTYLNHKHWGAPQKIKKEPARSKRKNLVYDAVGNPVEEDLPAKKEKGIGPHIHVDDFMSTYGGKVTFSQGRATRSHYVGDMNYGSYIDVNYTGGRHGFPISTFDIPYKSYFDPHPYAEHRPLCGSFLTGPFLLERPEFKFEEFFRNRYDERDPVYVKLDSDHENWGDFWCPLKLWDPVSDMVRVERICGNDTFISEFGYICSIKMYKLITGEEYTRWRLTATDF